MKEIKLNYSVYKSAITENPIKEVTFITTPRLLRIFLLCVIAELIYFSYVQIRDVSFDKYSLLLLLLAYAIVALFSTEKIKIRYNKKIKKLSVSRMSFLFIIGSGTTEYLELKSPGKIKGTSSFLYSLKYIVTLGWLARTITNEQSIEISRYLGITPPIEDFALQGYYSG